MVQAEFDEAKSVIEALRVENDDYRNSFETMKKQHADKMADLCQREEEAKKQVNDSFSSFILILINIGGNLGTNV
jgi:hypothetical protein